MNDEPEGRVYSFSKELAEEYRQEQQRLRSQRPVEPTRPAETAADLEVKQFMPLSWIIPQYIPEGLTLLAGKPKTGKSWLVLATALAVSRGKTVLDQSVKQRDVLYYALEDNERRMHARTTTIMNGESPWPANLWFEYALKPIDLDGLLQLQTKIAQVNPGVVIIDTLGRVKSQRKPTETEYQYDTRLMGLLHTLVHKSGVALVVVHHVRKQSADDPFDTISGTYGLTAVADTSLVLLRNENDLRLAVRGRDCDSEDKIIDFDPDTGIFNVTGNYQGPNQPSSETKIRILELLRDSKMSMRPQDIANALNLAAATVRGTLRRMHRDGEISRTAYGTYARKG